MAWLVQQRVTVPAVEAVEHTYAESVRIRNGLGICRESSTRDYLRTCGYDVVRELPELETLPRIDPKLALKLGRAGLGPLGDCSEDRLNDLAAEWKRTGRLAEFAEPAPFSGVDPAWPGWGDWSAPPPPALAKEDAGAAPAGSVG